MDGTKVTRLKWDRTGQCRAGGILLDVSKMGVWHTGIAWMSGRRHRSVAYAPLRRLSEQAARRDAEELGRRMAVDACGAAAKMAEAFDVDLADFAAFQREFER